VNPSISLASAGRDSQVLAPSDMVAVGDSVAGFDVLSPNLVTSKNFPTLLRLGDAHGELANTLFCDGHVESGRRSVLYSPNDYARSRWNIDHQPHEETWP